MGLFGSKRKKPTLIASNKTVWINSDACWQAVIDCTRDTYEAGSSVVIVPAFVDACVDLADRLQAAHLTATATDRIPDDLVGEPRVWIIPAQSLTEVGDDGHLIVGDSAYDRHRGAGSCIALMLDCLPLAEIETQVQSALYAHPHISGSQHHVSLDDPLMGVFVGERVVSMMQRLGIDGSKPIESPMVTKSLGRAQVRLAQQLDGPPVLRPTHQWLAVNNLAAS